MQCPPSLMMVKRKITDKVSGSQVKRVFVELKTNRTYHNTNPALQEHLAFESPLLLTTSIFNE